MGYHTFDPANMEQLDDPSRFRFCSREELLQYLPRTRGATILDIGSGTGFYTDELAPYVGTIVALDIQDRMHEQYQKRSIPDNVQLVTGDLAALPIEDWTVDGAVSTMTFHESTSEGSAMDLYRALGPGAPLVVVDWSSQGTGEAGPPLAERYDAGQVRRILSTAGFNIEVAAERSETFQVVARSSVESRTS